MSSCPASTVSSPATAGRCPVAGAVVSHTHTPNHVRRYYWLPHDLQNMNTPYIQRVYVPIQRVLCWCGARGSGSAATCCWTCFVHEQLDTGLLVCGLLADTSVVAAV